VGRLALLAVAGAFVAAPSPTLEIAFPEGWSARQMADRVSEVRKIAIQKRKITPVLNGRSYAVATAKATPPAGFGRPRKIEGFLYPARYTFGPSTTAPEIVGLQLQAFRNAWSTVRLNGRKPYDVLTVASMVERETVAPAERKLVAAVIYNRLAAKMPLGIDATLRYGLGIEGTRALTKTQLANPTPYNTRLHRGLPPTPIGNPGLPSIRAAAAPADVDYLYYVRKPDGVHHFFTADEAEFCAKAKEYGYRGC
jgi:uncharacterized YceG family protein